MTPHTTTIRSSGLSGLSLTHSDIGGYTMVDTPVLSYLRSKELLIRWSEMSAISDAVMRSHPGNLPQNSWQIYSDTATLTCFGRLVSLHKALLPYRTLLMRDAAARGHPLVSHTTSAFNPPLLTHPSRASAFPATSTSLRSKRSFHFLPFFLLRSLASGTATPGCRAAWGYVTLSAAPC